MNRANSGLVSRLIEVGSGTDADWCGDDEARALMVQAAQALDPQQDPNTVEVRIHVRVDVYGDTVAYNAGGWGEDGAHADDAQGSLEGETDSARFSVVTARVPKPSVAEVEGTVET